jgi:hypothetical protein
MKIGDLYVSAIEGKLASRPGPDKSMAAWIGAKPKMRADENGVQVFDGIEWDEEVIIHIPAAQVANYAPAWRHILDNEDVRERTKADYEKFVKSQAEASKAEGEKVQAEAKKRAEEDARAAKESLEREEKERAERMQRQEQEAAQRKKDREAAQKAEEDQKAQEARDLEDARKRK